MFYHLLFSAWIRHHSVNAARCKPASNVDQNSEYDARRNTDLRRRSASNWHARSHKGIPITVLVVLSVEEHRIALAAPAGLVVSRQRLQIGRRRRRIVHPTAQQIASVDHVDRGPILLVLVGKVAPDRVIRP